MVPRHTEVNERERELDREVARYREAATAALQQLEWIVGYLDTIRKPSLARALERNRRQIAERLR